MNYVVKYETEMKSELWMDDALKKIPVSEIDAYKKIMKGIMELLPDMSTAILRALFWILRSKRLLRMNELREVIWVEENDVGLNTDKIDKVSDEDIIKRCDSLVIHETSTGVVRFSHATVRTFLESFNWEFRDNALRPNHLGDTFRSETGLAKTCLTYLNFAVFGPGTLEFTLKYQRMRDHRFYPYAAQFWDAHVRDVEKHTDFNTLSAFNFLACDSKRNSMLLLASGHEHAQGETILHIAAQNGLVVLCNLLLNTNERYVLLFCLSPK